MNGRRMIYNLIWEVTIFFILVVYLHSPTHEP
jgi:hypothetical protein